MKSNDKKKFYETLWFCILMLFVFAPIGIFLLWKYKYFSVRVNVVLSVVAAVLFVVFLATPSDSATSYIDEPQESSGSSIASNAPADTDSSSQDSADALPPASSFEYDALQQLYLDLDPSMSYEDMLSLVQSTNLPYSEEKYNGSRKVQVAFTDGCTVQRHKKESGDYLEIIYEYPDGENSANDVLSKYVFGTCAYHPSGCMSLISHVSGAYFSYYEPGNYISDLGKKIDLDKNMSKKEQLEYYFLNK